MVTARVAAAVLSGAAFGAGLWALLEARGLLRGARTILASRRSLRKYKLEAVGVLLAITVTRSAGVALTTGLILFTRRWWDLGAGAARRSIADLDALAAWLEAVRDLVNAGSGLEQAMTLARTDSTSALRDAVDDLVAALDARVSLAQALTRLADRLADGDADRVVAAVIVAADARGAGLVAVLSDAVDHVRRRADLRRRTDASRASTRRGAQMLLAVFGGVAAGLVLFSPEYLTPYRSPVGRLVLLIVASLVISGLLWLRTLSRHDRVPRFLSGVPS